MAAEQAAAELRRHGRVALGAFLRARRDAAVDLAVAAVDLDDLLLQLFVGEAAGLAEQLEYRLGDEGELIEPALDAEGRIADCTRSQRSGIIESSRRSYRPDPTRAPPDGFVIGLRDCSGASGSCGRQGAPPCSVPLASWLRTPGPATRQMEALKWSSARTATTRLRRWRYGRSSCSFRVPASGLRFKSSAESDDSELRVSNRNSGQDRQKHARRSAMRGSNKPEFCRGASLLTIDGPSQLR